MASNLNPEAHFGPAARWPPTAGPQTSTDMGVGLLDCCSENSGRTYTLRAFGAEDYFLWVDTLQKAIVSAKETDAAKNDTGYLGKERRRCRLFYASNPVQVLPCRP
jgi:hypothetical protein